MREVYNSRPRNAILDLMKSQKISLTAKEIFEKLRQSGNEVSMGTIYRALSTFADAGLLIKNIDKDGSAFYLYTEECEKVGHCFLKCRMCGSVEHIDCALVSKIVRHIYEKHDFLIDDERVVLSGLCSKCNEVGDY